MKLPRALAQTLRRTGKAGPRSKYGNVAVEVNGRKFHSRKEAARYVVLCDEQARGLISGLRCQVGFRLVVNDVLVCRYRCDFAYIRDGRRVVEDVKGMRTDVYKLKRNLMLAVYGVTILET